MKPGCSRFFRNTAALFTLLTLLSLNIFSQPQYYNYNTTTGGNAFPFSVVAGKVIQWIVLPGEFAQPTPAPSGNITKIHFLLATASITFTNLTIKMGTTTDVTLPTDVFYTGQLDTVYFRPTVQITSTAGTFTSFTLDVPYNYDNTKSLVIEVNQCGASATGLSSYNTTLTGIRRTYNQTAGGCNYIYQGQSTSLVNCGIDVSSPPVNCSFSWGTQTSGSTNLMQAVSTPNQNVCWIGGATGTMRLTANGGSTWTDANPNPGVIQGDVSNIWAFDGTNALITSTPTSPAATFIYRTTNAGVNWTQVFTQASGFIDAIVMVNATTGYAYGDPVSSRWSLWKTTNGGINWDSTGMYLPQAGTEAGWNNSMCVVGSNIWFGTNNTRVYHSTNAGATGSWTPGTTTGNVSTYGVWFVSSTDGICVGTIVQKTTDGGTTWVNGGTVAGTGNMTSIGGIGNNFWLTRGNNTYGSTDFGATWTGAGFTGTQALWATYITPGTPCLTGWSTGAGGTVVKLNGVPVAVNDPSSQVPSAYKLEQNYPNPFNPVTSITYSLPLAGNVELKIYDILGKEVANLVSSFMTAGTHNVSFDASSLASGIYIYKINAGTFNDSKKMVLIK